MSLKQAAEQALEALRYTTDHLPAKTGVEREVDDAITALQVALSTEGNTKSNLPPVKTYCGGKPNYCTSADAVNMSQECVYETVKIGHKWVGLTVTEHDRYLERQRIAEEQHIKRVAESKPKERNCG